MIRPEGRDGVAFTESHDGDLRHDPSARARVCRELGIAEEWAALRQVHGSTVHRVGSPGVVGEGDAMWTDRPHLPLAVFTADCYGVALHAAAAVGVAHAGWRGAALGVVGSLREEMESAGHPPLAAAVGPGIGPCCFEVGPEVVQRLSPHLVSTGWGSPGIDLPARLAGDLAGIPTWWAGRCTMHQQGSFSHRLNRTMRRMATVVWRR